MGNTFRTRFALVAAVLAAFVLLLGACGGDDGGSTDDTDPPADSAGDDSTSDTGDDAPSADDDGAGDDTGDDVPPSDGGGDLSLVPEGETDIVGNPAGQGFVELDGTRYDFILNGACQKLFGAVQASGPAADGSDVRVDAIIPPEDWETDTASGWDPPYVQVDTGDVTWRAETGSIQFLGSTEVQLTDDQSAVTSFTNDGSRATGDAVFYNLFNIEEIESVTGSFDLYCP